MCKKGDNNLVLFLAPYTFVFTLLLLWKTVTGKASTYYFYKIYFLLWLIAFVLVFYGVVYAQKQTRVLITGCFIVSSYKAEAYNDLLHYNYITFWMPGYSKEKEELYHWVYNELLEQGEELVPMAGYWEDDLWYQAITNQRYYGWGQSDPNHTDYFNHLNDSGAEYILVLKDSQIYQDEQAYFDSLERIYDTEIGFVGKLIHLEAGKNVGFVKSFEWLIANGGEADYYAFSDQDDFWFPDKIKMALELLDKSPSDVPVLYFSNYDYYDGELNFVAHRDCKHPNISFANSMVDCVSLGFNSVFNRKAKDMVTEQMPKYSTGHDWWMYMVCVGMGKVIYDERATVKYRRTGSNVSNSGDSFWKAQVWRFKKFFLNHYFKYIRRQIREYAELYKDKLSEEDRKTLYLFTQEGFHPIVALKKVFYPHKLRQGMIDEIFVRVLFLIGRL